jgi:hypothetical protein
MPPAGVVDELGHRAGLLVRAEADPQHQRVAGVVSAGLLGQPGAEGALAGGRHRVRLGRARAELAGADVAGVGQPGQLAVDLAAGDAPERLHPLLRRGDQLAAGHRPLVQQTEQGSGGGVQIGGHVSTVPRRAAVRQHIRDNCPLCPAQVDGRDCPRETVPEPD